MIHDNFIVSIIIIGVAHDILTLFRRGGFILHCIDIVQHALSGRVSDQTSNNRPSAASSARAAPPQRPRAPGLAG